MSFETFEFEMKLLKKYKENLEDIEREIDDICYQYAGVRGVSYDKQRVLFSPEAAEEQREKLYEALKGPQKRLDQTTRAIEWLEPKVYSNISKLPAFIQSAVRMKFWENLTYVQIGRTFGYSDRGMKYRIEREIAKI